ncbi:MAG TPA: enolase C-terminal domain-like protein [Acidimicrobiales bacterium]|nr:enolase C-terminal domain-like protein [Acidimicrobiales bacterium]
MIATLYRQNAVLAQPVRASEQEHRERSRLFLRIERDGVVGYGEVAPQPHELNGDPGFGDVVEAVGVALLRLEGVVAREGELPSWSRVARFSSGSPKENVATTLVEMALLDRELRASSRSIVELWPRRFVTPTQATVSLLDDAPWRVDGSARRVRVKCAPGDLANGALERLERLSVPVIVDYNCSVTSDLTVLTQLELIRRVATVAAIEQPYEVGNFIDHARLAALIDVPVSIDEGLRSTRDLTRIVNYGAATMICVKPARVGGLANARTLIDRARDLGVAVYVGGFFESPFARGVHRALAESCVNEPSDLSVIDVERNDEVKSTHVGVSFGIEPAGAMLASAERLSVTSLSES